MSRDTDLPFALPQTLPAQLPKLYAYWNGLKRAQNAIPFWDDVKLSDLPDLAPRLMLIDAFAKPARYRFALVGSEIVARSGTGIEGLFVDDVERLDPFHFFIPQCAVTVEAAAGSFYRTPDYARLLLPMWGDGQISMLLGGFGWTS